MSSLYLQFIYKRKCLCYAAAGLSIDQYRRASTRRDTKTQAEATRYRCRNETLAVRIIAVLRSEPYTAGVALVALVLLLGGGGAGTGVGAKIERSAGTRRMCTQLHAKRSKRDTRPSKSDAFVIYTYHNIVREK